MCGAVRFKADNVPVRATACHCDMCRRWTGSAMISVAVPEGSIAWQGEAQITTLQSSDWAERAWCKRCGSGIYYRTTAKDAGTGHVMVPIGLFDDPNGFTISHEIWIDHKPDSFSFAGVDRKTVTRQEFLNKFPAVKGA